MGKYSAASWTDDILLDLIRLEDDRAAFTELYLRHWEPLLDTAYQRLKSEQAAKDAVQQLFVDFFIRRQEVVLKSSLGAYLKTALKFHIFKSYRAQQVRDSYSTMVAGNADYDSSSPDVLMESKEMKQKIYEVASRLPEKCREVFMLSRFEQYSHQDIADKLHISVSTVKKHLHKATTILRSEFAGHQMDLIAFGIFIFLASK